MKRAFAFAMCLCVLAAAAPAQETRPVAQFLQVTMTTVKGEAVAEYEDYIKKIVAGAGKASGFPRVTGYQVTHGGPAFTYVYAITYNRWADLDSMGSVAGALEAGYGAQQAAAILKAGRAATARSENAVYRLLPELSTRPQALASPSPYVLIVRTEVEPGMARTYEDFLAKLKAAQEKDPAAPMSVRRVSALGPALVYVTAQFFATHAERDAWPTPGALLRKALGEAEGSRVMEESGRAVRHRDVFVMRHRPDLSHLPPAAAR